MNEAGSLRKLMAEMAESVEEQDSPPAADRAPVRAGSKPPMLARKAYAQQLARIASRAVRDRRQRAEVKIHIYNQLLPVLESHARERARLRSLNQRLFGLLFLCVAMLGGAIFLLFR